jgi:hypothetical protein
MASHLMLFNLRMRTQVMVQDQIEELEVTMEQVKEVIAVRDSLRRLAKNKDFKKIIDIGYFTNEASRVVLAKANPHMQTVERQTVLDNQIIAIGGLRQYFSMLTALGNQAERDLEAHQQDLEMLQNTDEDENLDSDEE